MAMWTVRENEEGMRLDKYLTLKLGVSGQRVKSFLDNGKVRVNGKRVVIAKWEMIRGDEVSVNTEWVGEQRVLKIEERKPEAARLPAHGGHVTGERPRGEKEVYQKREGRGERGVKERPKRVEREAYPEDRSDFLRVLYEDRDIIVVNKPAGVVVLAGHESKGEGSLVDMVKGYLRRRHKESRGAYVRAVHRLDRDTTGVVVLAKSLAGARLEQQFRRHQVEKGYLAIVEGRIEKQNGKIALPIEKGDFGYGRKAGVVPSGEGSHAETDYDVVERYREATIVHVKMRTGRTHQIRVHLSAIGHPIVGDKAYGPHGKIKFKRQALHAERIVFSHPVKRRRMEFNVPPPKDMKELIEHLRVGVL